MVPARRDIWDVDINSRIQNYQTIKILAQINGLLVKQDDKTFSMFETGGNKT